jgi:UDP:flavonoid glycosyltransferase YjiC (YdhE family)
MPEAGHFQRLRPLIADLSGHGFEPHVFTDRRFAPEVERAGGRFVDVFAGRSLGAADGESVPFPCRYVSFAGHYADDVIAEVEALAPAVVVYDTFAVIGLVVGRALGVPYVNVCAGHNMNPVRVEALIANHPRVDVSDACHRAVETLRSRHGIADASPFSYLTGTSPHLNLYCEPPEFLAASERDAFEPVAFYGSLPGASELEAREREQSPSPFGDARELKLFASFGTVAWRYWPAPALDALRSISSAVAQAPRARAVISLGGARLDSEARQSLEHRNVEVADYVDQWRVLREADIFITHQGLNSTHEAIYNRVPMLSYPFFSDQPGLVETCGRLGLAIPLAQSVRAPLAPHAVAGATDALSEQREAFLDRLSEAREWELRVIADRPAVVERISALTGR